MIHRALPQTMTPENLAEWIKKNCIDKKIHEERIPLEEHQITDLEHRSSVASRQIDKLERQLKEITDQFKNGTTEPIHITIPFTKGLKTLTANREFADGCIEKGFTEENTTLYGIPFPEREVILFCDIEGQEYETYQENMTPEQIKFHGNLFKEEESLQESVSKQQKAKKSINKVAKDFHDGLAESGMKVSKVEGSTVTIETGHPKKKIPAEAKKFFESGELPESDIGGKSKPDSDLINPFA